MQEIVLGVTLFTGIVIALALMILLARSQLVPSGDVTINVNGEREIAVGNAIESVETQRKSLPS